MPEAVPMKFLLFCTILSLVSCSTTTVTTDIGAVLSGKVYNENGTPLAGVVLKSGRYRGISDNFGRFRLDNVPRGEHRITVHRDGYETHVFFATLQSPHHFARVSLWSLDGLIDLAIAYIRSNALDDAYLIYERCCTIDPVDSRVTQLGILLEPSR